eukprot:3257398-Heterocapsa_arctica.AAC.1
MNIIAEAAEDNLTFENPPTKRNDCEPELQYAFNDRRIAVSTGTEEEVVRLTKLLKHTSLQLDLTG